MLKTLFIGINNYKNYYQEIVVPHIATVDEVKRDEDENCYTFYLGLGDGTCVTSVHKTQQEAVAYRETIKLAITEYYLSLHNCNITEDIKKEDVKNVDGEICKSADVHIERDY